MTGGEIAQIITSIAALIGAVGSIAALIQGSSNGQKSSRIEANVATLEKNTNSKMDALLNAKVQAATAEATAIGLEKGTAAGLEQGRKEERK